MNLELQPNFNFSFNVNFQLQFLLNFSFNFKYTCIDQHVSARAGRAIAQLLHVCSLAWRATRTYTKVMYTYIYVDTNHIYIHLLTHIFSMHKTKPSPWAPEWGDDSCRSRALHGVGCPRARRAGCRGMGQASDRWMASLASPHYGGYTTRTVRSGAPPTE